MRRQALEHVRFALVHGFHDMQLRHIGMRNFVGKAFRDDADHIRAMLLRSVDRFRLNTDAEKGARLWMHTNKD